LSLKSSIFDDLSTPSIHSSPLHWHVVIYPPLYKCPELQQLIDPWKPWLARCHFLRLPQGGHFPHHLDGGRKGPPDVFRIIVPIQNCVPPNFFMMIKSGANFESVPFKYGMSTFVNTTKRHVLFNANSKDSIMLIMNIKLTDDSFSKFRFEVY
jgi:hypothetical protein